MDFLSPFKLPSNNLISLSLYPILWYTTYLFAMSPLNSIFLGDKGYVFPSMHLHSLHKSIVLLLFPQYLNSQNVWQSACHDYIHTHTRVCVYTHTAFFPFFDVERECLNQINKCVRQNNPYIFFDFQLSKILSYFRSFVLLTIFLCLVISLLRIILQKRSSEMTEHTAKVIIGILQKEKPLTYIKHTESTRLSVLIRFLADLVLTLIYWIFKGSMSDDQMTIKRNKTVVTICQVVVYRAQDCLS